MSEKGGSGMNASFSTIFMFVLKLGIAIVAVVVIITIGLGLISGIIGPRFFSDKPDKAKVVKAKMNIENMSMALEQFHDDNGFYPSTELGLQALIDKPESDDPLPNYPEHAYMHEIPEDPWGNEYVYEGPEGYQDFEIISYGADGEPGGTGFDADISSEDMAKF